MHKITLLQPVMHDVEHRGLHSLLPPQWNAVSYTGIWKTLFRRFMDTTVVRQQVAGKMPCLMKQLCV